MTAKTGIQETLYLMSIPGIKRSIIEVANQPIEERISLEELEWELTDSNKSQDSFGG